MYYEYYRIRIVFEDDSPENESFSGFHHPVSSHEQSLRVPPELYRTDPYRRFGMGSYRELLHFGTFEIPTSDGDIIEFTGAFSDWDIFRDSSGPGVYGSDVPIIHEMMEAVEEERNKELKRKTRIIGEALATGRRLR